MKRISFPTKVLSGRVGRVMLSPYLLALIASLVVISVFRSPIPEYLLTVEGETTVQDDHVVTLYEDVDGNGFSDRVFVVNTTVGDCGFSLVRLPGWVVQEWNLPGRFLFDTQDFFMVDDYDGDGKKEAYVLTILGDSLLLHIVPGLAGLDSTFRTLFLTRIGLKNGKPHLAIRAVPMTDLNGDGRKELVFAVISGYPVFPRKLFAYDVAHDTLLSTPELGANITGLHTTRIKPDGKLVFYADTYASTNLEDPQARLHDNSSWLMVFDSTLNFLFPPREFPGRHGGAKNFIIRGKREDWFGTQLGVPGVSRPVAALFKTGREGQEMLKKEMSGGMDSSVRDVGEIMQMTCDPLSLLQPVPDEGIIEVLDGDFNRVRNLDVGWRFGVLFDLDADGDGETERLNVLTGRNKLFVFRPCLEDSAWLPLELAEHGKYRFSYIDRKGEPRRVFFFTGEKEYTILYRFNKNYYWQWGIYAGLYLSLLLFALLVQQVQRVQMRKRQAAERKITELQLAIVRNQLDPHFTMNAINAVTEAVGREEKEAARENLLHFSRLYRSLVLSADRISRSLREEIGFTESYLSLERFRFGNRFSYVLDIDASVDLETEVPKMVIQGAVENAVKHGIRLRETGGEIRVRAVKEGRSLVLEIADNGPGRAAAQAGGTSGTGKGMQTMAQFFDLYRKVTGVTVEARVDDLADDHGNPAGTRVRIEIREG